MTLTEIANMGPMELEARLYGKPSMPYARLVDEERLIRVEGMRNLICIRVIRWSGGVRVLEDIRYLKATRDDHSELREWRAHAVQEYGIPGGVANGIVSDIATYLYFLTDSN